MGNDSSKSGLARVTQRSESRVGKIAITGRYHRLPKRITDDYILESKVLGSGYNGQVHLAQSRQNGQKFAVKGFKLHGVPKSKQQELEAEAEIFLGMDHPHVARLVDVYESEEQLNLVMECMTGGELFKRVSERRRFSEKDGADATYQMLLAVNYIHTHDVVHRDIKLENFLYESPESDHLKLIDFGFSKIWSPNTKMAMSCGTLAYVAPEVLTQSYTSQCDMWSLGVTVFIVLFGYMPFSGSEERQIQHIKSGRYTIKPDIWSRVSEEAQDFVKGMLVTDPQKRMTAMQALAHPWIAKKDELHRQNSSLDMQTVTALVDFAHASAFRRAAMSMMAWSLSNDERAKVRQAFLDMDVNRTGTITIAEFKQVLEDKFHIADAEATRAFAALDTNNTHEIQYSEFLAAMVSSRIALHDDLLLSTFKRFDTDNSGYISAENLKEVLGQSFEGEEVDKMMAEVDLSHDNQISYQEFIAFLRGGEGNENHQDMAARFIDEQIKADTTNQREQKMRQKTGISNAAGGPGKAPAKPAGGQGCCCMQ
mmetsp:Transcript_49472/g.152641  ORF Transcript_49472/g.152641 Transcript_49472/m.152641 type:complete len:538 (-) Transcript_49472:38-1651(-)